MAPTRRTTLRGALPAAALALSLALAGCGGGGDDGSASAGASRTPSPTTSAPVESAGGGGGQALFVALTEAMTEAGSAEVDLEMSVNGQRITGSGAYRLGKGELAADMVLTMPGQGELRMVLLPDAIYLRLPAGSELAPGKPWLAISGGGSGDPFSAAFGPVLEQLQGNLDPASGLAVIQAATTVEPAGTETVDGTETTRYEATVDLADVVANTSGTTKQQYLQLVDQGVETLDFTLWADGEDLVRRFVTVVPTAQGEVTAIGTYRNWGEPVDIEAPPADEVVTSADLGGSS